jgi:two-component system, OmpR family, response regulator
MRVLVVKDEVKIAQSLIADLTRQGYVVEWARDGEEAWFKGETEDYDAIVMDLGLPKLDGLSVVRRLRAAHILTPMLVLTARGTWSERVEGIDAGADDYLPKPFHVEELIARLGAITRRSGGQATPILRIGDIRIDTRRMDVSIGGRNAELSALEFRALRGSMSRVELNGAHDDALIHSIVTIGGH